MLRTLVLLLLGLGTTQGALLFDLSNNTGLSNLFTGAGTDFINIDGNGLNLNIKGTLTLGNIDSVSLNGSYVLRVASGKRAAIKVDYDLALTFSSSVADFYFGTKGTTNQESFTLDLNPNGAGTWSGFVPYPGSTFASTSGIGTPVFMAEGPNGGNPVTAITRADATPVLRVNYNLQQQGANSTPEEYFWGSYALGTLPQSPVPEPSSLLLVGGSLLAFAWRNVRS